MPMTEDPLPDILSPPSLIGLEDSTDCVDLSAHLEDAKSEGMAAFMDSIAALTEVPHLPSELESVSEDVLIPAKTTEMSLVQRAVYEQRKAAADGSSPGSPPQLPLRSGRDMTSPAGNKRLRGSSPDGGDAARHAPMPKADGKVRFFCKHPNCGKGYASTDAVRKHCRQRHLEWLRRLGQGCPTLYCEWVDGDAPEGFKPSTF
jgi:hypothetical protein